MTRVVGGLAVAVGGAATVVLLYAVAVLDPTGRWLDDGVMHATMDAGAAVRDEVHLVLEVAAPLAMLGVAVMVVRAWRRGRRDRAVTVTAIVLGSQALTQALKSLLPAADHEGNSLPSGHVTVAVTALVAIALLVPRLTRAVTLLAVPVVATTGLATMLVGWHRPSDILAAVAVVVAVSGLTTALWAPAAALVPMPTRRR